MFSKETLECWESKLDLGIDLDRTDQRALVQEVYRLSGTVEKTCKWTLFGGLEFRTSCGATFATNDPCVSVFNYCPPCGGRIVR